MLLNTNVYKNVVRCTDCGNLKVIDSKCTCETNSKNYDKICVVENLADMWVIESANIIKGHFVQGSYKFEFNGENLSSGIYFVTLSTNRLILSNKISPSGLYALYRWRNHNAYSDSSSIKCTKQY